MDISLHIDSSIGAIDMHRYVGSRLLQGIVVKLLSKAALVANVKHELRFFIWLRR